MSYDSQGRGWRSIPVRKFRMPHCRPKQNGPPALTDGPKCTLRGLEGQVQTKLQHPGRAQTEYARSIPNTEGLSALTSSGNAVERTTALSKPGGHHARR